MLSDGNTGTDAAFCGRGAGVHRSRGGDREDIAARRHRLGAKRHVEPRRHRSLPLGRSH